jgi:hypothetical protein
MSRALILRAGTGAFRGVAGVKTAKLCAEQDQIGEHKKCGQHLLPGQIARGIKQLVSQRNDHPEGPSGKGLLRQNPAYGQPIPIYGPFSFYD